VVPVADAPPLKIGNVCFNSDATYIGVAKSFDPGFEFKCNAS
jgi:hypothetical protein